MSDKKISSYRKLKNKIAKLERDIYLIVKKPDTMYGMLTKKEYQVRYDIEMAAWDGSTIKK